MRYEKPEVHEVGEAVELIQVLYTGNPLDIEPSTQEQFKIDPQFASVE